MYFSVNTSCKNNMKNTRYPSVDRVHEIGCKKSEVNPSIPSIGVYNLLQLTSCKYRDAVAIDCLDVKLTYKEILDKAGIIAKAFKVFGVRKGDIISVQIENLWQSVVCFFAANRVGESTLSVVPFSYPYGFITSGLLAYLCGRTTILCP